MFTDLTVKTSPSPLGEGVQGVRYSTAKIKKKGVPLTETPFIFVLF